MDRIVGICGSTREKSLNKILLRRALNIASNRGWEVLFIDLSEYPLPLYDGDLEEDGIPENVSKLKAILNSADALIFSSPEYNSSFSGVLKNFIDWCSRKTEEGEKPLTCFRYKRAQLISTSPGKLGGLRGLYSLRTLLSNMKVVVFPDLIAYPKGDKLFDSEGYFLSQKDEVKLERGIKTFLGSLNEDRSK